MFRTRIVASDVRDAQREQGRTHAVLETAGKGDIPQAEQTGLNGMLGRATQFCGVSVNLSKSSISQSLFHLVAFSVMRWGCGGSGSGFRVERFFFVAILLQKYNRSFFWVAILIHNYSRIYKNASLSTTLCDESVVYMIFTTRFGIHLQHVAIWFLL